MDPALAAVDLPEEVKQFADKRARGEAVPATLEAILPGSRWDSTRELLKKNGIAEFTAENGDKRFMAADVRNGQVFAVAAAIPRNPGSSLTLVQEITDYQATLTDNQSSRQLNVQLFHRICRAEGIISNAINKLAALIAPGGKFKVNSVKGQRGKPGNKQAIEFETLCNWWKDNVNANPLNGIITGDRGIKSFFRQGTRLCLIEGDHIARHLWPSSPTAVPNLGNYDLPMNLTTYSSSEIWVPIGLDVVNTNVEILYWRPNPAFISMVTSSPDKNLQKVLKKLLPSKVLTEITETRQYFLDPSLLIHIRHRGTGINQFGVSIIEPVMADIRYKRALDALEIVSITNLINRLVILKVGTDNEKSAYHTAEVTNSRLAMLQRVMTNVGPAATVLWPGPDLNVVEVSAHGALLEMDNRYKIAERRILMGLGVPVSVLLGEGNDGKAVAFSSAMGTVANLKEVQDQYAQMMVAISQMIAEENNFQEVDVTWEWEGNLLEDSTAAADMLLKLFDRGLLSTQTTLENLNFDYDAETLRQENDVQAGYKQAPYGPPPSTQAGAMAGGVTGDSLGGAKNGGGRPTNSETVNQDPRKNKEDPGQQANPPKT